MSLSRTLNRAKVWAAYCKDCGVTLTPTEEHYYEYRCEPCERKWHERIIAWREGVDDPELDDMMGFA